MKEGPKYWEYQWRPTGKRSSPDTWYVVCRGDYGQMEQFVKLTQEEFVECLHEEMKGGKYLNPRPKIHVSEHLELEVIQRGYHVERDILGNWRWALKDNLQICTVGERILMSGSRKGKPRIIALRPADLKNSLLT